VLAYVYDKNGKLSLKEKPKPEPRDENAIIKVNACSICGTDLLTYLKKYTSKTFSLQNIKEAFKSIQNGNIIKAIIRPNK